MKVNIQKYTKRFVPLLTALLVFVACICFPAGAEPLNYRDYETNVTVDGSNDIVHVSFPVDTTFFEIWNGDELIKSSSGSSFSFDPLTTHVYYLHLSLVNDGISLDNIPSGATISYTLNFEGWGTQMETPRIWKGLYFYDSNHVQSYVGEYVDLPYDLFPQATYTYSYILPSTNNSYFKPGLAVYGLVARDSYIGTYNISVLSISIDFTISSLYRLQEQTGHTNDLLDEVNRQLEEQGKTMNDILNGTPEQNDQADQFKDNADSVIGDLNEAGDKLSSVEKPDVDVGTFVPDQWLTGSDYLTYTSTINNFWSSDILSNITIILGGMLVISYLLFGEKG